TLRAWRQRFLAHREQVERLYDQRFVRMWEFYLAASELTFRQHGMMVFQVQLTKRAGVVPITRDYIGQLEKRLREAENSKHPPLRLAGEYSATRTSINNFQPSRAGALLCQIPRSRLIARWVSGKAAIIARAVSPADAICATLSTKTRPASNNHGTARFDRPQANP